MNAPSFYTTLQQKKEIDTPSFLHLLADGQWLIYGADTECLVKLLQELNKQACVSSRLHICATEHRQLITTCMCANCMGW